MTALLPAAVLWDMDGTLVDTEKYWMAAETVLVESFGGAWSHEQSLQLVGSGEAAYAVGYVGRTIRANEGGAKYPVQWNTLLFSFDYWAVVRNSPNKAEAMKLIDFMTAEKPLTNLAQDWAVSPANARQRT